ncbi:hypothetical protein RUM44_009978 [Polyplax serrata]|uniref:Sushi, von Willebrand factor type A, EGF and pentraxin domain-containing protein 1 n=1 Tax=Polyplax serrata TaxID=468196 RepID=A0ABR1AU96_POLSC
MDNGQNRRRLRTILNVAAGKAPMQISTEQDGIPQKAIDGSTSSFFNLDTCTLTRPERSPWWYVNLLEPYMVQLVRLDFGKRCCGKNQPATIVVRVGNNRPDLGTNPICNRFTGHLDEGKPLFLPCNPPMPGAFVSVHLEGPTASQLSICEAFVYTDQALPIERCPQFRDQPPGSTATYNGKCYIFYNRQPLNFRDALNFCRSRSGTLVDESNPALQGFISWELWRRHRSDTSSQYWMGAVRDPQDRTNWKWIDGEDVTVSFWNLPGGNEDCARYDGSKGWLWSDTNCNANLNFICQHQPKSCGKPEQPPNSTMVAKNFNVGATVDYECDEGHLLVGPSSRLCLPTGFYNEFPPVCKRITCGYPAGINHGDYKLINGSVTYLSHVVYSCDDGYDMVGRARLVCDIDERWNGPPPRCEPILCHTPPDIPNGRYVMSNNNTIAGTVVEYSCDSRKFKLVGAKKLVCLPIGQYDKLPPVCKEDTGRPLGGLLGAVNKATTKPVGRPPRPPLVTLTPSTPPREDVDYEGIARRPTKVPISKVSTPVTEKTYVIPTRTTTQKPIEAKTSHGIAGHPQENEIPDSVNIRSDVQPNVNVPSSVEEDRRETSGARLNLGAIISLGVFGGFVFLAAVVTTIVILIRRNRSATHYRHRASPDCNTVASYDSSSSESHGGLNRYYRQAWENLHTTAGGKPGAKPSLRRTHGDTLNEPMGYGPKSRRMSDGMRDGSEIVINEVASIKPSSVADKKRHHHHHHHHSASKDEWRQGQSRSSAQRKRY